MATRPNITVLDGHTLNPGDLDWGPLQALGECTVYPRTADGEILARAAGAQLLLTNKTPLSRETLLELPALRYVGVLATGHDIVDVATAAERGVVVTNVPAYGTASVAQHVLALLLALTNRVSEHAAAARAGRWSDSGDFSHREHALRELSGCTLGLVGYGRIGQAVARLGQALGMRVVASTPHPPAAARDEHGAVRFCSLEALLSSSDVVSLHCPLTAETSRLIDAARLSAMKPGALLINTARGGLIDEPALDHALRRGSLAGAALDVLSVEPPPPDHRLLQAPNCIVTPHIAWATEAARQRLLQVAVDNVEAFLRGRPVNKVA